ncbi:MAG: outer membrane lipoprotein chaperone LolA [Nevskia sp.]|nr:outer membrane lipoprotein chaperone LolA [Gammaproteobacteria bacterium]MDH4458382.1 outer membrane lipoprotein chaperone LolA [Nevskia sp.]
MSRLSKLLLSIPLCVMPVVQADSAQDTLKRFVDGVQTFDARFDQTQTDERGTVTARSSGRFLLSRPAAGAKSDIGRFRWAYEKPYEQLSICDGTKLWAFDPDLNQATVRNAKSALAGTPAALLSQRGGLTDAFVVQDGGSDGDARVVRLLPKAKDSDFKSIELSIDKAGAPLRMRFQDPIGGSSEVKFSTVATNKPIDAAQFQFTPPKGTEVVDGDSAPSAGGAASRP